MPRAKDSRIEMEGQIVDLLPNAYFTVELDGGQKVLAHLCGQMRRRYIAVRLGDRVVVELSPYDLTRGRIMQRLWRPAPGAPRPRGRSWGRSDRRTESRRR